MPEKTRERPGIKTIGDREVSSWSLLSLATRAIDELNRRIGIVAIYLVLFAALVSAFNAIFRYSTNGIMWLERHVGGGVFGGIIDIYRQNSNTLSESQWYMFAGMVMLGGAWTLKVNEHVRVDLVYGSVSERTRTWIDLLGGIFFLLPMCALMIYFTWPWFMQAWITNEGSATRWRAGALAGQADGSGRVRPGRHCRAFPRSSNASWR